MFEFLRRAGRKESSSSTKTNAITLGRISLDRNPAPSHDVQASNTEEYRQHRKALLTEHNTLLKKSKSKDIHKHREVHRRWHRNVVVEKFDTHDKWMMAMLREEIRRECGC